MQNALLGTRVLITQATEFMGPVLCEVFAAQGAEVVASTRRLCSRAADCFVGQVFPVCGGWVMR